MIPSCILQAGSKRKAKSSSPIALQKKTKASRELNSRQGKGRVLAQSLYILQQPEDESYKPRYYQQNRQRTAMTIPLLLSALSTSTSTSPWIWSPVMNDGRVVDEGARLLTRRNSHSFPLEFLRLHRWIVLNATPCPFTCRPSE